MTIATIDLTAATPVSHPIEDAMTVPTLSLCIPTYNRAKFLDYLLSHIARDCQFDFTFEIVISDNASPDETPEVVAKHQALGLPISYYRQTENKGGAPNLLTAFHRARGKYVLYLADDDLLIPEGLSEHIHYLLANPEIRACYAPWMLHDDINKIDGSTFYDLERDMVFGPGDEIDLLTLIVKNHIFPEITIYRADAARAIVGDTRFCYWAFTYLSHIVAQGPVAFRSKPFYRFVTNTSVDPSRIHAGNEQAMVDWDGYRGGLEYMVYALLRRAGVQIDDASKRAFRDMLDVFIDARMRVALRLWLARRDFPRAYELVCRLSYLDPSRVAGLEGVQQLPLLLIAQTLARLANGIAGLERLVLAGVEDGASVGSLLREVGLERRILVTPPIAGLTETARSNCLVFLGNEAERQSYVDQGFGPGMIISEGDLTAGILL